jgi:hypothetical protein
MRRALCEREPKSDENQALFSNRKDLPMNRTLLTAIGVAVLPLLVSPGRGQEGHGEPKDFAKLGSPGAEHKSLQKLVGTWELSVEGSQKKGTARLKSIWDGRFVTEEVTLPLGGFTLEWQSIYGYDKHKRKYTAVWVDNMDTNTESGEGDIDKEGKTLTFKGQHEDPRSKKLETYLWRITMVDDSNLKIEMLGLDNAGKATVELEIRGRKS